MATRLIPGSNGAIILPRISCVAWWICQRGGCEDATTCRSLTQQFSKLSFGLTEASRNADTSSSADTTHASSLCPNCEEPFDGANCTSCPVWSCSFLLSPKFAVYEYVPGNKSHCLYCDHRSIWPYESKGPYSAVDEVNHLVCVHGYRSCDQPVFFSESAFFRHLLHEHYVKSWEYWTSTRSVILLLDACKVMQPQPVRGRTKS